MRARPRTTRTTATRTTAPYPWAQALEVLAIARRDGDGERATRARETFADLVRLDRTPVGQVAGSANLATVDWYEEAARAEAELFEEPVPGIDELAARLAG